jgi:hypothetical protein
MRASTLVHWRARHRNCGTVIELTCCCDTLLLRGTKAGSKGRLGLSNLDRHRSLPTIMSVIRAYLAISQDATIYMDRALDRRRAERCPKPPVRILKFRILIYMVGAQSWKRRR